MRMAQRCPSEYRFHPKTWVLPEHASQLASAFRASARRKKGHMYICKPASGSQGRGIVLVPCRRWDLVEVEQREPVYSTVDPA